MPKILERLIRQLNSRGLGGDEARATAVKVLTRSGAMKDGKLTAKGRYRQKLGNAGRAKERAARGTKNSPSDYKYDPKTNRATLKR